MTLSIGQLCSLRCYLWIAGKDFELKDTHTSLYQTKLVRQRVLNCLNCDFLNDYSCSLITGSLLGLHEVRSVLHKKPMNAILCRVDSFIWFCFSNKGIEETPPGKKQRFLHMIIWGNKVQSRGGGGDRTMFLHRNKFTCKVWTNLEDDLKAT